MRPVTTEWLRDVARLAETAKAEAARHDCPAEDIIKRFTHEAVELPNIDFRVICEDLGLSIPTLWSEKQSLRFACQIEAQRFGQSIITESVEGVL